MDSKDRDALIAEKREEIKKLEDEIRQLRCNSFAKCVTSKCYHVWFPSTPNTSFANGNYGGEIRKIPVNKSNIWEELKKIGCALHKRDWRGGCNPKIRELSPEQVELSVKMIDEMTLVWNKYFVQAHPEKEGELVRREKDGI